MAGLAYLYPMRELQIDAVRIYNDCCFTSFSSPLEETVVPHPNQKHTEKEIMECVVKTSQMVTSQSQKTAYPC